MSAEVVNTKAELVGIDYFAKRAGVSPKTLRRWWSENLIPKPINPHDYRGHRWRRADIEAFLTQPREAR